MKTQVINQNATAHFYDGATDMFLQPQGSRIIYLFDSVSQMLAYAEEKGLKIINTITHHDC